MVTTNGQVSFEGAITLEPETLCGKPDFDKTSDYFSRPPYALRSTAVFMNLPQLAARRTSALVLVMMVGVTTLLSTV